MKVIGEQVYKVYTSYDDDGNSWGNPTLFSNHSAASSFAKGRGFSMGASRDADVILDRVEFKIYDSVSEVEKDKNDILVNNILSGLTDEETDALYQHFRDIL